jgi:hypothetical protein
MIHPKQKIEYKSTFYGEIVLLVMIKNAKNVKKMEHFWHYLVADIII